MIRNYWSGLQEWERARIAPAYIFIGEEDYLKNNACRLIAEKFTGQQSNADSFRTIYGSDVDGPAIVEQCINLGLFRNRQVLVVREADALSDKSRKALLAYLEKPSLDCCLILISNKSDEKASWIKEFENRLEIIKFTHLEGKNLFRWLFTRARERGLQLDEDAAETLVAQSGNSLGILDKELEKISHYLGQDRSRKVDSVLIRQLAGHSAQIAPDEFYRYLTKGDRKQALTILQKLLESGEDPVRLAAGYFYKLERYWQASLSFRSSSHQGSFDRSAYYMRRDYELREIAHASDDRSFIRGLLTLYDMEQKIKSGWGDPKTLAFQLVEQITATDTQQE